MSEEHTDNANEENTPKEKGKWELFLMRLGILGELLLLFIKGDRWWMAPLILALGVMGLILVLLQTFEYIAPFVYVVF